MKLSAKLRKRIEKVTTPIKRYGWWLIIGILTIASLVLIGRPGISLIRTRLEIRQLNNDKAKYEAQIRRDSLLMKQLQDDEFLEEFARETYYMQRPNEQVFIIGD